MLKFWSLSACDLTPTLHHLFVTRPENGSEVSPLVNIKFKGMAHFPSQKRSLRLKVVKERTELGT